MGYLTYHTYSANDYATLEDVITHYLEGQRVYST